MKKIGYTLAEVLITVGIIGVIAAITLPTVVNNIQVKMNMSRLSKTVADLDNAFTSAVAIERTPDVFSLSFWPNGEADKPLKGEADTKIKNRFLGNVSKYLNFNSINKTPDEIYGGENYYALDKNGSTGDPWNNDYGKLYIKNAYPIQMKNGAIVFLTLYPRKNKLGIGQADDKGKMNYITEAEAVRRRTTLRCATGFATIDVNGAADPNTVGRDIFVFIIGQNGYLYPYGGAEYTNFDKEGNSTYIWSQNHKNDDNVYDGYTCKPEDKIVQVNGMGCTGRVVEEDYKMTY